ncbi:pentapeptide repeat-containing protein [Nannocystis bainbridge]|uniref:Pentapeptide repeat-containing protein n=1 Tax=Nannocystis bainbridge TaxID=2995303 RepID=A0ABT5E743_9BACT|nr:pentapeptide repeat-containing protein [Nannocystis bainbridge]MDC0721692.1 pentapeptide repeat-containing protein [Nannocystis bainbridge]
MADPVTLALVTSSIKLLESGCKLSVWDGWTTFPTQDRLGWLTKLLGLGADVIGKASDLFKSLAPASARPEQAVHLWAIHVACFGEALAVYWGGSGEMAGRPNKWGKWFAPTWVRGRLQEVEAAIKFALDLLGRATPSPLPRDTWLETPTASPMYQALWAAFTDPAVTVDAPPLLPREQDGDVQTFERAFTRAFREVLARGGNAELRTLLTDGLPRGEALRRLLVTDIAAWRHKHVFAGVDTSEGIPDLPLEQSYVEPNAKYDLGKGTRTGPVLTLLAELLCQHKVVCVSADFGMGKSLTARTLAWRWASAYLDPNSIDPSCQRVFPIYVRCADSSIAHQSLDDVIRRALKRSAEAIGVSLRVDDPAFAPPREGHAVILLDGLDELAMNTEQARNLLRELFDYASDEQRFIVFSRPEALSQLDAKSREHVIPHVKLQRFDERQIDEWLWAWPNAGPTRENIALHGLTDLAQIPILLFMLVLTWPTYARKEGIIPQVQIYEAFFDTLATGKYQRSGEVHPQIKEAAERARETLVSRGELPPWKGEEGGRRSAIEAIRLLMDRVAWEAMRREFSGLALSRWHILAVLENDLGISESTLEQVRIGLLLGMQAQFAGGSPQFFFGHRSFLEFAAARFWERQLRRLLTAGRHNFDALEEGISGAPLVESDSRVLLFLRERLDMWGEQDRRRLLDWARATVEDEAVRTSDGRPTFRNDQRTLVRQAALAIGCHLAQRLDECFDIGDGSVLLTISTWWTIVRKKPPMFFAPVVIVKPGSLLLGLVGQGSNFEGAHLEGANLDGASLEGTNFRGANLKGAHLAGANLRLASFYGANLNSVSFIRADLLRADLCEADLVYADLEDANLYGAKFCNATLFDANFANADLQKANFAGADLEEANLFGANLEGVNFEGASLAGVFHLHVDLARVRFDTFTRWPDGFIPLSAIRSIGDSFEAPTHNNMKVHDQQAQGSATSDARTDDEPGPGSSARSQDVQ